MTDKFVIRKTHGLLPWQVTAPPGTWFSSPTFAHAVDVMDHLIGHHRAHQRRHRED